MFKQKFVLEINGQDERVHRYECCPTSPLGEIYDALSKMRAEILKQINEHNKKELEAKKDQEKDEKKE